MTEIEQIKILSWLLILIFAFIYIVWEIWHSSKPKQNSDYINNDNSENIRKLSNKIEKESLVFENMKIKKEEIENEIEALKIEWSMDFEKEMRNEKKIKKLDLQVRQMNMKLSEKEENIQEFKR